MSNAPIPLVAATDPKDAIAFACGECRIVAATEAGALACCVSPRCHVCDGPTEHQYSACAVCRGRLSQEHWEIKLAAATVVTRFSDPDLMYCVEEFEDRFYDDPDAALTDAADEGLARIHVWPALPRKIDRPCADTIGEHISEDFHEDIIEDLDLDALQTALDTWWEAQTARSFFPDYSRVMILDVPPHDPEET